MKRKEKIMKMNELEKVKFLYATNWWDGPICGLCEYNNKIYWYDMQEDSEYDEKEDTWTQRKYIAREIEPWQLTYELYWHSIFVSNVYRDSNCRSKFEEGLKNERFYIKEDFYKKRKKEHQKIDYSNNEIIGTFKF